MDKPKICGRKQWRKRDKLIASNKWNDDYNPDLGPIAYQFYEFQCDVALETAVDERPNPEEALIGGVDRSITLDKLGLEMLRIIEENLTEKQKRYLYDYFYEKMTYHEVGRKNGVSYTTVMKSLNGTVEYDAKEPKLYGGALKRLKIALIKDCYTNALLKELNII